MARLDRLATVWEIAQIGATLGREFSYELLTAVSPLSEDTLQQGLKQLVEAELVYQSGLPPQARYLFKHALVQDTAYQSLLKSRRQQLHQQVAQVLEKQFPQTVETRPELVAHHYTEAGLIQQAIPYWQQAGERAVQRSANEEAVTHLTTGIELLKTLPDSLERPLQEMTLQTALGTALLVTKGLGAHEVRQVYDRVRQLGRQLGDTPELYSAFSGLSMYYLQQEEMLTAIELGQQCLVLAERQRDTGRILDAHRQQVGNWFFHGDPARAHEHCEQGTALYDFTQHHSLAFVYGLEGGVTCMAMGAWALWYLGYPDQALERSLASLALARKGTHQPTLAWALEATSWLYTYRREGQAAYELADEAVTLSIQQEFPHWIAMGMQRRGEALRLLGQWEEGTIQFRQGVEGYVATGAVAGWAYGIAELARSCLHQGQYEEGLGLVDEALQLMNQKTMHYYAAEKYRIKGELLRQKSEVQGPESEVSKSQILNPWQRPRRVSLRPLRLRRANTPNPGNSVPPQASLVSGNSRTRELKLTSYCLRSTTGSPKGLTQKICRKPRRCWRSCRISALFFTLGDDCLDMALECGKPPVNDPPDQFKVYSEIFVDEHIPQCDDASPGDLRILLLDEIRRQVSCRFSNNLQGMNNGVLDHRVCKKSLASFGGIQFRSSQERREYASGRPFRLSQRSCFFQNPVAKIGAEATFRDNIHLTAQEVFQVELKLHEV
jgi:tetratricopeptide (TPR) repeat protein